MVMLCDFALYRGMLYRDVTVFAPRMVITMTHCGYIASGCMTHQTWSCSPGSSQPYSSMWCAVLMLACGSNSSDKAKGEYLKNFTQFDVITNTLPLNLTSQGITVLPFYWWYYNYVHLYN